MVHFFTLIFLCGSSCVHLIMLDELDFNYFKMNEAIFSLLTSDGLVADPSCAVDVVFSNLSACLLLVVFDPHVLEVTTHLKITLSVMEGMSSLSPLPLSQRLQKKKKRVLFLPPLLLLTLNPIEIWDAVMAGDRGQLLRM